MSKSSEIAALLSLSAEQLAVCAGDMAEAKLLEKEHGLYKIGKAITEINEVLSAIYEKNPELCPEGWGEPPTEEQYRAWFEEAKKISDEYVAEGSIEKAMKTIDSFLYLGPCEPIAEEARKVLETLRASGA